MRGRGEGEGEGEGEGRGGAEGLAEGAMSTRKGNVIRLLDLVDESVKRARAVVDEKSPDLDDNERAAVAEAVGTGAIRYADLSQNPQSNVTFTWDKMLSLEGNTAPYLMYSYARCRSIQADERMRSRSGRFNEEGSRASASNYVN